MKKSDLARNPCMSRDETGVIEGVGVRMGVIMGVGRVMG